MPFMVRLEIWRIQAPANWDSTFEIHGGSVFVLLLVHGDSYNDALLEVVARLGLPRGSKALWLER